MLHTALLRKAAIALVLVCLVSLNEGHLRSSIRDLSPSFGGTERSVAMLKEAANLAHKADDNSATPTELAVLSARCGTLKALDILGVKYRTAWSTVVGSETLHKLNHQCERLADAHTHHTQQVSFFQM